ncbi:MAG: ketoacyl-ACP synthase III [Treponema sp.]|nr:ketoacyl-ACP synthase III [Treponema sp.]
MAFEITGTGRAVPSRQVSNHELENLIETTDEWIRLHTGICFRHIAGEETAASDLAVEAAKNALLLAVPELSPEESSLSLDLIIVATASPDYFGTPSTACIVQEKLGAKNAAAMDISAGCTGFIYGLETAAGMLALNNGKKRILIIGTEVLSKFLDWSDRTTCILFGDGAGAAILEKTDEPSKGLSRRGIIRTVLHADGSGGQNLNFARGGSRNPFKAGETIDKPIQVAMNGQAVYNFAVKSVTDTIKEIIDLEGINIDDVALIIPHQANARIIQAAAKRLNIPEEKFYLNIAEYANTSAASIPIALDELNRSGKLMQGNLILTIGFGGGLTYGANLIIW